MSISCADANLLVHNIWFLSSVGLQAVAGYVSAIICITVAIKCRNLHFHVNWRVLTVISLSLYILHSILIAGLQTTQLIQYLTTTDPCNLSLPPVICFALRYPASSCAVCFAALQFSMVIERAVALWKRQHYESYGPKLGIISAIVSIAVSFSATAWAAQNEDFRPQSFYCSSSVEETAYRLMLLTFALSIIDLITLVGIISLNIFNNYAMKWLKMSSLRQSYQLRENASVIRVMLPLTVFQTICYLIFSFGYPVIFSYRSHMSFATYRTIITSCYVLPFYTTVSPILMWLIIRWSKKMKAIKLQKLRIETKSEKDVYFQELKRVWDAAPPNK